MKLCQQRLLHMVLGKERTPCVDACHLKGVATETERALEVLQCTPIVVRQPSLLRVFEDLATKRPDRPPAMLLSGTPEPKPPQELAHIGGMCTTHVRSIVPEPPREPLLGRLEGPLLEVPADREGD